ncbi:unnamed protein product [Polarella glacialis]|uniref:ADF-H domain-containing protein n=1 Tax=Polarella glacialis TaxID=89957 RepID=A0A813E523_POLGL|nr:unnamed protein product [Polarella glacialis]
METCSDEQAGSGRIWVRPQRKSDWELALKPSKASRSGAPERKEEEEAGTKPFLPEGRRLRASVPPSPSPSLGSTPTMQRASLTSRASWSAESHALSAPRKRSIVAASQPVCVLGVGAGGIEELSRSVDDRTVAWALLRFQVGGGTFVRTKLVAVHCNGGCTPVMQRGLLNARHKEVVGLFGDVHASIEVTSGKELTVEYLCERLLRLFAADDMDYSLEALRQDYSRRVAQTEEAAARKRCALEEAANAGAAAAASAEAASAEAAAQAQACELLQQQKEKDDREKQTEQEKELLQKILEEAEPEVTVEEALRCVSTDQGTFNWLLLEPTKLALHKAGKGGLDEMKEHLSDHQVLFGLLRLSFGSGSRSATGGGRAVPGISKHVFVHWVGPRVSVVKRGVWNTGAGKASALIGKSCSVTFRREAHTPSDIRLEDIVSELRYSTALHLMQPIQRLNMPARALHSNLSMHNLEDSMTQVPGTDTRRLTVVDGVAATNGIAAGRISVEEYRFARPQGLV